MSGIYAAWTGQPVILQLTSEGMRVPVRGVIVGECESAVRFYLGEGFEIDIYKDMILAVEVVSCAASGDVMFRGLASKSGASDGRISA